MAAVPLPIANGFYLSDSLPISAQECTNFRPNIVQAPALNQETLFGTPGIDQLQTTGELKQINRGAQTLAGVDYRVNGTTLYRMNQVFVDTVETFTIEALGTVEGEGRVSLAENGTQLMILVPGGAGYIFTADPDTFTIISDPDFIANGAPQHVVFIDGFFAITTDSKKFIVSALNDGLSYNALDFGTAESDPDDIVAPIVFKNQLFIGGSQTLEAFQNIGGADFPFQRTGLFISKGIFAPFSIINSDDTFMFIGGDENESPAIWAFAGNTVQKVSTTAIDSILQDLTAAELDQVFAYSYAQKGAYITAFTLPSTTLEFNSITQRWNESKSFIDGENQRCRINSLVTVYGRVVVGDSVDGRIGELDPDVFTEYGEPIFRRIATQPFQNNMQSMFVPKLELTIESGVGNDDVEDPKMRMDRSTDGGKTFVDSRTRSMGKKGEFDRRVIWRRLGRASRFEIFRFTLTDAVKPVIIMLTAEMEGGTK